MKYSIKQLDGRYTHRAFFEYCAEFSRNQLGPLDFHNAMAWMIETYGYSAEVRDWRHIRSTVEARQKFNIDTDIPTTINPQWSWTNGSQDLRIYFATDKEVSFFKLKWQQESQVENIRFTRTYTSQCMEIVSFICI